MAVYRHSLLHNFKFSKERNNSCLRKLISLLCFLQNFTQYIPLSVYELESWLGNPSIYVFDCSAAGMIVNAFCEVRGSCFCNSPHCRVHLRSCQSVG
jgi:hypothetical protein